MQGFDLTSLDFLFSLIRRSLLYSPAFVGVFVFLFLWLILWLPLALPLAIWLKWKPGQPLAMKQKLPLLASLYFVVPLVFGIVTRAQSIPVTTYGWKWDTLALKSYSAGLLLSLLGLFGLFTIQYVLNWINWEPGCQAKLLKALLPTFLLASWIGATEELIFRGFLQTQLQQDYSAWVAAVIGSIIFAVSHMLWEGRETLPQLPGLCLMGLVLVLARWVDQGYLGLAWGLHTGWVWGIASLDTAGIISYTQQGPVWMTGLGQKPLAGVLGVLLMAITGLGLWFLEAHGILL